MGKNQKKNVNFNFWETEQKDPHFKCFCPIFCLIIKFVEIINKEWGKGVAKKNGTWGI